MKIGRRALLKAGAIGVVATSSTAKAFEREPALVVFDSRLSLSALFAPTAIARIDVAGEDANFWRNLRAAPSKGRIAGLTRWSDLVLVRGLLEEQGKRLVHVSRSGKLFEWEMA